MRKFECSYGVSRSIGRILAASMLAAVSLIAACSGDDPTSTGTREFGSYTLASVNQQTLPVAVATAEGNLVLQSASLTLTEASAGNPAYSSTVTGTADGEQATLLTDAGTYTLTGSTITFSSALVPGLTYPGTVGNNTVTLTVPGLTFGAAGAFSLRFEKVLFETMRN